MPLFENSSDFVIKNSIFVDVNQVCSQFPERKGINLLLKSCLPEAIHSSYAHEHPTCHPGTREGYIRQITDLGPDGWKVESEPKQVVLVYGPAGAGKSAIAQSCAEEMEKSGKLGATFFFYRPSGWNNPKKFVPTIAYQLAMKYPAYRDRIDVILEDALILDSSMKVQFKRLLEEPLSRLEADGQGLKRGLAIIIDGLDECQHVAGQVDIIELVLQSAHQQTTPFSWAFFSRPEPRIWAAFSSEFAASLSCWLEVTASACNNSRDIETYLRGSFKAICANYGLGTATWPPEEAIQTLIRQSSGLFIYAATAIRYIGQDGSEHRIEERLRLVLNFPSEPTRYPFAALDRFYTHIMEQIPEAVLQIILSLICMHFHPCADHHYLNEIHNLYIDSAILNLSSISFHEAIRNLHSVLFLKKTRNGMPGCLAFHHQSFYDFLRDEARSGPRFCVERADIYQQCTKVIVNTLHRSSDVGEVSVMGWMKSAADKNWVAKPNLAHITIERLFHFGTRDGVYLEEESLRQLTQIDWSRFVDPGCMKIEYFRLDIPKRPVEIDHQVLDIFIAKIPQQWRRRIFPLYRDQGHWFLNFIFQRRTGAMYTIGNGSKATLLRPPIPPTCIMILNGMTLVLMLSGWLFWAVVSYNATEYWTRVRQRWNSHLEFWGAKRRQ